MKKILSVILVLSCLLTGCSDKNEYVNALPKNVAVVADVDVNAVFGKSGLNTEKAADTRDRMKNLIKGVVNGAPDLIDALFADANESGIDFRNNIYFFAGTGMRTYGLVARTYDSSKLEKLLHEMNNQGLCEKTEETDGGKFAVAANWLLAFSDKVVVAITDANDKDARKLVRRASIMLRQEEGEGFSSTPDFKELKKNKSDVGLWLSMDMLPHDLIHPLTMGASGDMDLKDVKSIAYINFEKGKTVIDFKTFIDDKYLSSINDKRILATNNIQGNLADDFPANTPIWINGSINGRLLYDLFQQIPSLKILLDKSMLPLDFEEIFSAFKGDCAWAVTDVLKKQFIFIGEVQNKDFMQTFEDLKPLMKLTGGQAELHNVSDTEYAFFTTNAALIGLGEGPAAYWFGVKGNKFYLTNNESLSNRRVLGLSMADRPFGKEIDGKRIYLTVNMNSMRTDKTDKVFLQLLDQRIQLLFGDLEYMTLSSDDQGDNKMEFVMKNKNRNLIEFIVQMFRF